ncbi:MAG: hypothetical protein WCI72_04670 [archaeon]
MTNEQNEFGIGPGVPRDMRFGKLKALGLVGSIAVAGLTGGLMIGKNSKKVEPIVLEKTTLEGTSYVNGTRVAFKDTRAGPTEGDVLYGRNEAKGFDAGKAYDENLAANGSNTFYRVLGFKDRKGVAYTNVTYLGRSPITDILKE